MTSTAITAYEASQDRIGLNAAYRLLWLSVGFDVLAFGVGFEWDRRWHATHAFEGFFSSPQIFVYRCIYAPR